MPFGIIIMYGRTAANEDDYLEMMANDGIYIREAQYKTFLDFYKAGDKNVGFASNFDKPVLGIIRNSRFL